MTPPADASANTPDLCNFLFPLVSDPKTCIRRALILVLEHVKFGKPGQQFAAV